MDFYFLVKWAHILSSTVLFGTGLGTALHMLLAHRSGNVQAIAVVTANVVRADTWCTLPSGIVQPVTGFLLIKLGGYDPLAPWLLAVYAGYLLALVCWLIVVVLQLRMRDLAQAAAEGGALVLPADYHRAMRIWFWLGWPAFFALLGIFWLMVHKPQWG